MYFILLNLIIYTVITLTLCHYEAQRDCVWLVALGLKIAKGYELEGNPQDFPIGT